eukprot:TRINITY_DN422_c19_g1_i1.p1 TRINITY_DN422_c19_g1~~TRINITY_DN422_c19_g1_i1.p1  ORF type:complete len:389 (+),score=67.37 TRINITY_DN422_c19_g1_i1:349-1515(+)
MPRAMVPRQTSISTPWSSQGSLRGLTPPVTGGRSPTDVLGGRAGALYTPPGRVGVGSSGAGGAGRGRAVIAAGGKTPPRVSATQATPSLPSAAPPSKPPAAAIRSGQVPVGSGLAAAAHGRRGSLGRGEGMSGHTWPGATTRIGDAAVASLRQPTHAFGAAPSPQRVREPGCGRNLIPAKSSQHEYTVVFDLDETLVSNRMAGFRPAIKRPHLENLLRSLRGKAEIVLWTASIESVGRPVLRQIDPNSEYFHHAIYRDPAWFQERPNVPHHKDLRLLGRDMSKVIIVENNPFSVRLNKRNAVLVPDFDRPNPTDGSLRRLEGFLGELLDSGRDVADFVPNSGNVQPMRMLRPYGAFGMGGTYGAPSRVGGKAQEPFYYLADARRASRV